VPGINVPYEEPLNPEIVVDSYSMKPFEGAKIAADAIKARFGVGMEIETLIDIGTEIRDVIRSFIHENADYAEMFVQRPKDITRRMDMAAEHALDDALMKRGLSARIISEELATVSLESILSSCLFLTLSMVLRTPLAAFSSFVHLLLILKKLILLHSVISLWQSYVIL